MAIHIFERCEAVANRLLELVKESGSGLPVFTSDTYTGAVSLLHEKKAKYILLDLNFPGNISCSLVELSKSSNPDSVVIVLYSYEDKLKLKQCLDSGADYLFNKYEEFEKIPAVINSRV